MIPYPASLATHAFCNTAELPLLSLTSVGEAPSHQVRLFLSPATMATLIGLQSRFVAAGRRKPPYSVLLDAIVDCSSEMPLERIVARVEGTQ